MVWITSYFDFGFVKCSYNVVLGSNVGTDSNNALVTIHTTRLYTA